MLYVDSSLLLSIYLAQDRAAEAQRILGAHPVRVASWLVAVEVPVVLRRALQAVPAGDAFLIRALQHFDADVRGIALYDGMPEVAGRVRADARLSRCRSSDAIHIATAIQLREETGHPVTMATFDLRLAEVARAVDIPTVP